MPNATTGHWAAARPCQLQRLVRRRPGTVALQLAPRSARENEADYTHRDAQDQEYQACDDPICALQGRVGRSNVGQTEERQDAGDNEERSEDSKEGPGDLCGDVIVGCSALLLGVPDSLDCSHFR